MLIMLYVMPERGGVKWTRIIIVSIIGIRLNLIRHKETFPKYCRGRRSLW